MILIASKLILEDLLNVVKEYFIFGWELITHKINKDLEGALSGLRQILATESFLKMMKNTFYFILKVIFFLEYLLLCLDFFVR